MALSLLNKVVMNRMKWLSNNFKAMGDKVYPEIWCSGLIKPVKKTTSRKEIEKS